MYSGISIATPSKYHRRSASRERITIRRDVMRAGLGGGRRGAKTQRIAVSVGAKATSQVCLRRWHQWNSKRASAMAAFAGHGGHFVEQLSRFGTSSTCSASAVVYFGSLCQSCAIGSSMGRQSPRSQRLYSSRGGSPWPPHWGRGGKRRESLVMSNSRGVRRIAPSVGALVAEHGTAVGVMIFSRISEVALRTGSRRIARLLGLKRSTCAAAR